MSALQGAGILASHYRELFELAVEGGADRSAELVAVGERLDAALLEAFNEGATLFVLWRATGLPVIYLLQVTTPKA